MILSRGELLLGSLGERRGLQRSFWGERELLCGFFFRESLELERGAKRGYRKKEGAFQRGCKRDSRSCRGGWFSSRGGVPFEARLEIFSRQRDV